MGQGKDARQRIRKPASAAERASRAAMHARVAKRRRRKRLRLRRRVEHGCRRACLVAAVSARAARHRVAKMTAVPRRLPGARRRLKVATAQRAVLSHQRLRRTTSWTNSLALHPMGASRRARVERVRLAARYIPTCGCIAARPTLCELCPCARPNPLPTTRRRVGRAVARLALQPMGASRRARVERVGLAARYIPTCGCVSRPPYRLRAVPVPAP